MSNTAWQNNLRRGIFNAKSSHCALIFDHQNSKGKILKTPIYISILLGLFLFAGCPSTPESVEKGLSSRPPEELVTLAIQETREFEFCLSEEADAESLKGSVDRLQEVVEALSESVSAPGLAQGKKAKLSQSIEAVKTACDGLATSAESQATSKELSKASSKIRGQLVSISKMLR